MYALVSGSRDMNWQEIWSTKSCYGLKNKASDLQKLPQVENNFEKTGEE